MKQRSRLRYPSLKKYQITKRYISQKPQSTKKEPPIPPPKTGKIQENLEKNTDETKGISDKVKEKKDQIKDKLKDKTEQVKDKTKEIKDKISDKAMEVKDKISDKVKEKTDQMKDKTKDMRDKIYDETKEIPDKVKDKTEQVKDKTKDMKDKIYDETKEIPDKVKDKTDQMKDQTKNVIKDKTDQMMGISDESKGISDVTKGVPDDTRRTSEDVMDNVMKDRTDSMKEGKIEYETKGVSNLMSDKIYDEVNEGGKEKPMDSDLYKIMTMVGTQKDFTSAMKSLVELEFDAIEAYNAAIDKLKNNDWKKKLTEFLNDHKRHVKELTDVMQKHGEKAPDSPDLKQYLTKGKVLLANLGGDNSILGAMLSNEGETNVAYQRMVNHEKVWSDSRDILNRAYEDEKRHAQWLQKTVDEK